MIQIYASDVHEHAPENITGFSSFTADFTVPPVSGELAKHIDTLAKGCHDVVFITFSWSLYTNWWKKDRLVVQFVPIKATNLT